MNILNNILDLNLGIYKKNRINTRCIWLLNYKFKLNTKFWYKTVQRMSVSSSTMGGGRTKYKVILLGDQSVGKSSIIEKYIKDKFE